MTESPGSPARPEPLQQVNRYRLAATYGHQHAYLLHRQLLALDAVNERSHSLLDESVSITLHQMPALTRDWFVLARQWSEQELLDPPKAELTARTLELRFSESLPNSRHFSSARIRSSRSSFVC